METRDNVILTLPRLAVGQILEGLEIRAEAWKYTEEYLRTGHAREPYIIEDCSDPEEAEKIAAYYREIIESIKSQLNDAPEKRLPV